jgi:AbrB family looped-hinge helix DNA binding protein
MATTIVSAKGQIIIPSKIRNKYNIKKGTRLYIEERNEELVLKVVNNEYMEKISGILKTGGKLSNLILAERARDKERENYQ